MFLHFPPLSLSFQYYHWHSLFIQLSSSFLLLRARFSKYWVFQFLLKFTGTKFWNNNFKRFKHFEDFSLCVQIVCIPDLVLQRYSCMITIYYLNACSVQNQVSSLQLWQMALLISNESLLTQKPCMDYWSGHTSKTKKGPEKKVFWEILSGLLHPFYVGEGWYY